VRDGGGWQGRIPSRSECDSCRCPPTHWQRMQPAVCGRGGRGERGGQVRAGGEVRGCAERPRRSAPRPCGRPSRSDAEILRCQRGVLYAAASRGATDTGRAIRRKIRRAFGERAAKCLGGISRMTCDVRPDIDAPRCSRAETHLRQRLAVVPEGIPQGGGVGSSSCVLVGGYEDVPARVGERFCPKATFTSLPFSSSSLPPSAPPSVDGSTMTRLALAVAVGAALVAVASAGAFRHRDITATSFRTPSRAQDLVVPHALSPHQ
jgi:hypothetical protein